MGTKEQILLRSRDLFMRYGIKSITMDDLSRELGISKKTLYQYVDNKQDLIEQIFQATIMEEKNCMAEIRHSSTDAIEEILGIGQFVIEELRQISPVTMYDLQKYYRDTWLKVDSLYQQHVYQIIRDNLDRGIAAGLYRSEINPDIIAKLYVGKTAMLVDEELFPLRAYSRESLFKEYINYHIHGIASPEGLALLEKYLEADNQR